MSKKSRKRNKKILAALALAGGAAMLAKGRGKGIAQGVSGADKAAFTSDAAYKLPSQAAVAADIAKDVVPNKSSFKPRIYPGTLLNERAALPGAGVKAPPGILNPYNPQSLEPYRQRAKMMKEKLHLLHHYRIVTEDSPGEHNDGRRNN